MEIELTTKELILATFMSSISDFLYYDRKEDEELPLGAIKQAIKSGVITIDEITGLLEQQLKLHAQIDGY